jgi:tetratricopeptide (TPR) repeat protein
MGMIRGNRRWNEYLGSWRSVAAPMTGTALLCGVAVAGWYWVRLPETQLRLAERAVVQGNLDLALQKAQRLASWYGKDPLAALVEAEVALARRDLSRIRLLFDRIRNEPELAPRAMSLEGQALLHANHKLDAGAALLAAAEADPDLPEPHRYLGAIYYDGDDLAKAVEELTLAASLAPRDPGPHFLLGHLYFEEGDPRTAEGCFEESLRRSPWQEDRAVLLQELAEARMQQDRFQDALDTLADCEPSAGADAIAAQCYRSLGRIPEALAAADRTLRANPTHLEMLLLKGRIAIERNEPELAYDAFTRAVESHPKSEPARVGLAETYRRLGEDKRAEEEEQAARRLQQLWDRYRVLSQEASVNKEVVGPRFELALIALELDQFETGVLWLRTVLRIDPNHKPAAQVLNNLMQAMSGRPSMGTPSGAAASPADPPDATATADQQPPDSGASQPVPAPDPSTE